MYIVVDFYENPDGEIIYHSKNLDQCKKVAKAYAKDVCGACCLKIFKEVEG